MDIVILGMPVIRLSSTKIGVVVLGNISNNVVTAYKIRVGQFGDGEFSDKCDPDFFIVDKAVDQMTDNGNGADEADAINEVFDYRRFTFVFKSLKDVTEWMAIEVRGHVSECGERAVIDASSWRHDNEGCLIGGPHSRARVMAREFAV